MDLTLGPDQEDARAVAAGIMEHEESCEEGNGLPADTHARIADPVREHGLNAINMPTAWGGQGFALVRQVAWEAGLGRRLLHGKAAVVKLSASEAAGHVVDRALQIHGGRG